MHSLTYDTAILGGTHFVKFPSLRSCSRERFRPREPLEGSIENIIGVEEGRCLDFPFFPLGFCTKLKFRN